VGNSHAKDMFNALQLAPFGDGFEFVPLITNIHCRMSRADRLFSYVLPMRAAFETAAACEATYPFLDAYLDELAGVIIAPLWQEQHLRALPSLLDRLQRHEVPVLVVGNTARFNEVPRLARNLVMAGVTQVAEINDTIAATRWDDSITNAKIYEIARQHEVIFLDRGSLVCPDSGCDLTYDYGSVTLFDSGHWTLDGARRFSHRIYESQAMLEFMRQVSDRNDRR
jgi:hypothetical protein